MPADVTAILKLEVPLIVRLGERQMTLAQVISLVPGVIIELPKSAEEELELLVNNKRLGLGTAVKVGENFGIRITQIGDIKSRVEAMGGDSSRSHAPSKAA